MQMSVDRAERIGPTGLASDDWYTAARRVMPPSTCSSKTVSASISPAWGRASGALSSLMMRATRASTAGSATGMPVSGAVGAAGGAVVVGTSLVGGTDGTLLALLAGSLLPLPPQAANARAARTNRAMMRRRMVVRSELLEGFDPVFKGCGTPSSLGGFQPQMGDAPGTGRHRRGVSLQLLQRRQQTRGVPGHADRLHVGQRLPLRLWPEPAHAAGVEGGGERIGEDVEALDV